MCYEPDFFSSDFPPLMSVDKRNKSIEGVGMSIESDLSYLLTHWIDQWVHSLIIQNFSHHTITGYRSSVANLAKYILMQCEVRQHASVSAHCNFNSNIKTQLSWSQCDKRMFTGFVAYRLDHDGISPRSAKKEVSAIRKFYTWMVESGHVDINPTTGYQLKNISRSLPNIADIDLLQQLLEQPTPKDATQSRLWKRDKAMFELLYGSGLRVSELVGIDSLDIDLLEKKVRVIGKGGKTRIVPMSNQSISAIQAYLPLRIVWLQHAKQTETALFISERMGSRLTTRAVQQRLKICAKRANIAQNMYPHLLRHCFASHLLSDSGDLRAIQEMLGHEDVSTTQVYTQVDFAKLTQTYDSMHPRARKTDRKL